MPDIEQAEQADIVIRHTPADGTILEGSRKGDGVWEIVKRHGFTYRPDPGIFIRGSRDQRPQQWRIEQAAKALAEAGFTVTVAIDDTARPTADVEADRASRLEDRQAALDAKAVRRSAEGHGRLAAERQILDMIPPGQPILVGHHSEGRHRRDLARAQNHLTKGLGLVHEGEEAARRAEGSRVTQAQRYSGPTTVRRIAELEADRRKAERDMAPCHISGKEMKPEANGRTITCPRCYHDFTVPADLIVPDHGRQISQAHGQQLIDEADDALTFWRAHLQQLRDSGEYTVYGPDDFTVGGLILVRGRLCVVLKLNKKTVKVHTDVGMDLSYGYEDVQTYLPPTTDRTASAPEQEA